MCSNQWGRYAPIRSRNKIPKKTLIQIGSIGSQFNKPNLFEATISEIFNNRKANKKFMIMVVRVKNKFGIACFHFLYLKRNNETLFSKIQKKLSPLINNNVL